MSLQQTINNNIMGAKTILDVCAGNGHWLKDISGIKTAIEANKNYNEHLERHGYDFIDNRKIEDLTLGDFKYDIVICIDGIEHIKQDKGLAVIEEFERVGDKILIFTPDTFIDNKENAMSLKEPLQEHLSVWPKEFWLKRGYTEIFSEYNASVKVNNILYLKDVTKRE